MKSFNAVTSLFVFFAAMLFSFVGAAPLALLQRDVYVPPVLTPTAGTVWTIGSVQTVTWDTSDPPAQITNRYGEVLLRNGELTLDIVLASGFDILDGSVEVTVPAVEPGDEYAVVLIGDSGNFSEEFTIVA